MDFEKFERLKELVPDEEQQLIIGLQYELNELERKEKIEDAEYESMLEEAQKANDSVQLEQFLADHISVSEYNEKRSQNMALIEEIENRYGIDSIDRRQEEMRVKAISARQQLGRIKKYYERTGQYIMRNVDVDALSDEEAVTMWRSLEQSIDVETLKKMLNDDIRNRMGLNDPTPVPPKKDEEKEKLEKEIEKFKSDADKIQKEIDKLKGTLVLDIEYDKDLNDAVRGLTEEIDGLSKDADELTSEIEEFKKIFTEEELSMSVKDIKATIKDFKTRLKELKQNQVDKYNARVDATNKQIEDLISLGTLDNETVSKLESLRITRIDTVIKDWKTSKYLQNINYNKLVEVNNEIASICDENKITLPPHDESNLEAEMAYIENEIDRIEEQTYYTLTDEETELLNQNIVAVANRVNDFRVKLETNKDKITEEEYNNYLSRLNDAEANLAAINAKLNPKKKSDDGDKSKNEDYNNLKERLERLKIEVDYCNATIEALYGHLLRSSVNILEERINTHEATLEEIKKDIEEKRNQGKLDDNQYRELNERVAQLEETLKLARNKVKNPGMFKDIDIFEYLNGRIDGVEAAVTALENQISTLDKPIKDKSVRKAIDKAIKQIEEEIESIEQHLEENKDKDPERYNELKERLDKLNERMKKLGVNYRKKCPLIVRTVKSAKNFFQRHKKAILIAAGLAAFALVGYHVLIPAIMHGNIMLGATVPALRGFVGFSNNVLGSIIGANMNAHGIWALASGATINPAVASTSLLKGLAISGVSSALLVAPIVVATKKLVDKMKKTELKQKFTDGVKKGKEKIEELKPKKGKKEKPKNVDKSIIEKLAKMLKEYRKSGLTLEEFVEEKGLSETELQILEYLESESNQKQQENENKSGRKGR